MQKIPILYRDEHFLAVDKPSGLLVHPYKRETNEREHLMKWVKAQTGEYLYPAHRLDRPTSGIVLFCLSSEAARDIQKIWGSDSVQKRYLTLARGQVEGPGEFNFELSDENKVKKEARTTYWPLAHFDDCTLLKVQIHTGRKHQIRRHFSRRMHNIVGDTAYGKGSINRPFREKYNLWRIFLHAYNLSFIHPYTNENVDIFSPLSEDLEKTLISLGLNNYRELLD